MLTRYAARNIYSFLQNGWGIIDAINTIVLIIAIFTWIVFIARHRNKLEINNSDYFRDSDSNNDVLATSEVLNLYRRCVVINMLLISFKVIKYIGKYFEKVTVMFNIISQAKSDIFYFFVLYLIIFISFTTTFHIFYGSQVERFSTYGDAFNTLFLYLGRNIIQIEEMKDMSFNFTVVYFIIFITSMEFILMNMFIAIIDLVSHKENEKSVRNQPQDGSNGPVTVVFPVDSKERKAQMDILAYEHIAVRIYNLYLRIAKRCRPAKKKPKYSEYAQKSAANQGDASQIEEYREESKGGPSSFASPSPNPVKSRFGKKKNSKIELSDINADMEDSKMKEEKSQVESKRSKKGQHPTNYDSSHRMPSLQSSMSMPNESEMDGNSENPDEEGTHKQNREKTEEEIEKELNKLLEMRWNKMFSLTVSEDVNETQEAEKSEVKSNKILKDREVKLGKKLWKLIGYIVFFALFSFLVFTHAEVSMLSMYNSSLRSSIEGVKAPTFDLFSDSYNFINITEVTTYEDISSWMTFGLPTIFLSSPLIFEDNLYSFVNDYNLVYSMPPGDSISDEAVIKGSGCRV